MHPSLERRTPHALVCKSTVARHEWKPGGQANGLAGDLSVYRFDAALSPYCAAPSSEAAVSFNQAS